MPAYSRHDHPWRRRSFAASAALLLFAGPTSCGSGDQESAPQRTPAGPPSPATTSVTPPDGRAAEPGHEPPTPSDGLDPRFDTCAQANAWGYGPYVKGVDPEYDWYWDRDHDGIDCEP